jgi:hypothetical protein
MEISRFTRSRPKHNTISVYFFLAVFSFGSAAFAGPEDDLQVMFRGDKSLPPPGGIAGTVTNSSARHYACVDVVFNLYYKSKASDSPKEQRVRLEGLSPRSVTNYSAALQHKAGVGLKGVEVCVAEPVANTPKPRPDRDCTVSGEVTSAMSFSGIGDRGETEKIDKVFLLTPDEKLVSEDFLLAQADNVHDHRSGKKAGSRTFSFGRLPANLSYVVKLSYAWKTSPEQLTFSCPDSQGRYEFRLGPLKHIGNRLGG